MEQLTSHTSPVTTNSSEFSHWPIRDKHSLQLTLKIKYQRIRKRRKAKTKKLNIYHTHEIKTLNKSQDIHNNYVIMYYVILCIIYNIILK